MPGLKRAREDQQSLYESRTLETAKGQKHVIGNRGRVAVTQTRRTWNVRVGNKDVDRMNVLRVNVPGPTFLVHETVEEWIETFRKVTNMQEESWAGQQVFSDDGSKNCIDNVIDQDRCRELEFRIEFLSARKVAFAGAELRQCSKKLGIVVSLPHYTSAIQHMRPDEMEEVFEKCLLEMVDQDVMESLHLISEDDVNDEESMDDVKDDWEPMDEVELGIAIYVDNVGKDCGMTPVLSLCWFVLAFQNMCSCQIQSLCSQFMERDRTCRKASHRGNRSVYSLERSIIGSIKVT